MPNILGMQDWNVLSRKQNEHDMVVVAEYTRPPSCCVRCGVTPPRLKKYGVQAQFFMDTPIHGKRAGIEIQRQRFQCLDCGKTFQQPLPDMDEKRTMTRRCLDYIRRLSLERTFTQVSTDVGVNEKTVRNIFNDYVAELERSYYPLTPDWLGIDELFLVRKPRCIFTNVEHRTVMDLLPNRDKASVSRWLAERPLHELISVVTMDMWKPYRDAVLANIPHATIVVDKFHVTKMANAALDSVRKSLRDGMDTKQRRKLMHDRHLLLRRRRDLSGMDQMLMETWTNALPPLLSAYNAKEDFYEIYEKASDRKDAEELYDIWKGSMDPATKKAYFELIRAVDNWRPEVFNYFDVKATNAYTEAMNGVAKAMNHIGRGYSFEAIRAKVLFGKAKHLKKPKAFTGDFQCVAQPGDTTDDLGVSMPSLVELLSDGHDSEKDTLKSE
jgi:transposase